MNSIEADELASYMSKTWKGTLQKGFLRTIWLYPHARTLGFNHEETMQAYSSSEKASFYRDEFMLRFKKHVEKYHLSLAGDRERDRMPFGEL